MTERHVGDVTVLDLAGKLTLGEATERLHDKINSLLHQEHKAIVLNLGELESMDSGGLGELVRSHSTAKIEHASVRISNLPKRIQDLLTLTKLITVFDVFDSETDAVESFSP